MTKLELLEYIKGRKETIVVRGMAWPYTVINCDTGNACGLYDAVLIKEACGHLEQGEGWPIDKIIREGTYTLVPPEELTLLLL